jgi:antitoxin PrlF
MTCRFCTVNSRGQITIPMEIRTRLGINPGYRFRFIEQDDGIVLQRVRRFIDLVGIIPPLNGREHVDLEVIIREIREERADELVRRFNEESELG